MIFLLYTNVLKLVMFGGQMEGHFIWQKKGRERDKEGSVHCRYTCASTLLLGMDAEQFPL